MTSSALKLVGINLSGLAMALAVAIHTPIRESTGQHEGSGDRRGTQRATHCPSGDEGTVPQKRSLKSRQADVSMATRLRASEGIQATIGGSVRTPGQFKLPPGCTLWNAVQVAGGANEFGSIRRVKVYRQGNVKQYDLTKVEFQNLMIEADDCVEIPEKQFIGR